MAEAVRWYEEHRFGLGGEFLVAVDAAVDRSKRIRGSGRGYLGLTTKTSVGSSFADSPTTLFTSNCWTGCRFSRLPTIDAGPRTG